MTIGHVFLFGFRPLCGLHPLEFQCSGKVNLLCAKVSACGGDACTAQTRRRPEGRLGRPSDPWIWRNFRAILLEKVAVLHFQRKVV
jgi:hypothetical protein